MAFKSILFLIVGAIAFIFLLSHFPLNDPATHHHRCLEPHADFNLTNKIICVFPEIDVNPTDHYVSVHELTQWKLRHLQTKQFHRSKREMIIYDKNLDGFVSFAEFDYALPTPPQYAGFLSYFPNNLFGWILIKFNFSVLNFLPLELRDCEQISEKFHNFELNVVIYVFSFIRWWFFWLSHESVGSRAF